MKGLISPILKDYNENPEALEIIVPEEKRTDKYFITEKQFLDICKENFKFEEIAVINLFIKYIKNNS